MTDNRAELIISLRDELSNNMGKVTSSMGAARQEAAAFNSVSSQLTGTLIKLGEVIGITFAAIEIKSFGEHLIEIGSHLELATRSAQALGAQYGMSAASVKYFREEINSAGISSDNSLKAINAFLVAGVELTKIKPLAEAARDISAIDPQLRSTNEVFNALVESIRTGFPRALRGIIPNVTEEIRGASGVVKSEADLMTMTLSQRAEMVYGIAMGYAGRIKGVGEQVSDTYVKQQAKIALQAKETEESLWSFLQPVLTAVTGEKIKMWDDLHDVVVRNQVALSGYGEAVGTVISFYATKIHTVIEWISAHQELTVTVLQLYGAYKVLFTWGLAAKLWETGQAAIGAATGFYNLYRAGLQVGTLNIGGQALVAASGLSKMEAASMALGATLSGIIPTLTTVVGLLAAYGVYKSFTSPERSSIYQPNINAPGFGGEWMEPTKFPSPVTSPTNKSRESLLEYKQALNSLSPEEREFVVQQNVMADSTERSKKALEESKAAIERIKQLMGEGTGKTGGRSSQGEEGAQRRLENFIQNLRQQAAQAAGDSIKAADAWLSKETTALSQIEEKTGKSEEARTALKDTYAQKRGKIEQNYNILVAKESGNAYVEIAAQAKKWLIDYQGIAGAEQQIAEITARKKWELDVKNYTERIGLEKSFYDQAALLSPVLSEQIDFKRKAYEIEIKLGDYALATKLAQLTAAKQITAAEADAYRANQALLDQAKRFKFEMENNRGFSGWAYARAGEATARDKESFKGLMGGLESGFQNAFSSGLQGVLSKDQTTLKKISQTLWQSGIGEINKGSITRLFDSGAKLAAPQQYSLSDLGSGKGLQVGEKLSQAATGLNGVSGQFAANAAQFGLAAGGLLLSGVGIATNSQALVVAGTVLELAALAIQVYQALTATTTMGEMTIAAGALTGAAADLAFAATALEMAAIMDAVPFFHLGGIVAHQGWLVAHEGLNLDERRVIVQVGEGIIKRDTMAEYARRGISFDMLNSGRLPLYRGSKPESPSSSPGESTIQDNKQVHFNFNEGAITVHAYDMTQQEAETFVERKLLPAIQKKMGNRALDLMD